MDPLTFVRQLAPFRELPDAALDGVGSSLEVVYRPAGEVLLRTGGEPSEHLWIVRKGRVELRREDGPTLDLESGDWFGFPSLLSAHPPAADAVVVEDALLYRVGGDALRPLLRYPSVAAHVTGGLAARLRAAGPSGSPGATVVTTPAVGLVGRPPVLVSPQLSVREAAARMRAERISSVVVDRRPWALLTDRTLRDRVVAEGIGLETPAGEVATRAAATVRADATVADVLDALLDGARHHVLLTDDGTPTGELRGVVTTGDLLRREADSPVHVVRLVRRVRTTEELAATRSRSVTMGRALLAGGLDPLAVLRALSAVSDAATESATRLAGDELGVPTVPWAWVAVGSHGRREQGLVTDQDHFLVHAEAEPDDLTLFSRLAARTVELLEVAGFPRCHGDTMATRWSDDLPTWEARFQRWVSAPDQQSLYEASIFFDHRRVDGRLDVGALSRVLAAAGRDRVFLTRLASAASTGRPAIGRFHRLREDRDGRVDVKAGGLVPIVDLARLLSLEAARPAGGTVDRLRAATDAGLLSTDGHDTLVEAFGFLQRLRLAHHLRRLDVGAEADNRLDPDALSSVDRRHLKEVLAEVGTIQRAVLDRHGAADVAR